MIRATTWANLRNINLIERSQSKDHKSYDSIIMNCREKANLQKQQIDQWVLGLGGWGEKEWGVTANVY